MFDLQNLSLNTEEAQELSKAIFEHVLINSDLANHHDIHDGIHWDTQIPFIGQLGLVGKKILKCKPDANGNKIAISEKTWSPKLIGDRFEHCGVDSEALLKLFKRQKTINPDFYNKIDSEELGVVLMRISEGLKEMIQRIAWFGDLNADTVDNNGVFANGTDLGFFNMLNGFWKQILTTEIPSGSKYHVKIDLNDEKTYVEQSNLSETFAFDLFKTMWRKADARFKQLVTNGSIKPVIHCTSEISENWREFKESKSLGFTTSMVESGGFKDVFRNLEIVPRYDWDSIIQSYQDNGTIYNLPNRALMTVNSNIPVGTVSTNDLEKIESFYDKYNEVNVMDFRLKLDVKFLQSYMAVAAY